jgi:hypothetical protein
VEDYGKEVVLLLSGQNTNQQVALGDKFCFKNQKLFSSDPICLNIDNPKLLFNCPDFSV